MRALFSILVALLSVVMLAEGAEAQRRRRPRRPRPPAEQAEAPPAEPPPVAQPVQPAQQPNPYQQPPQQPDPAAQLQEGQPLPEGAPPEPSTEPASEFDPGPAPPDVSPIRAEYVTLMDDLVQARSRVAALGAELFRTRIRVDLQDRTGDHVNLARFVVHLDGAPVFQSDGPVENANNGREIFTGAMAPGPHVLTLEVEQRSREDEAYRYTLRESFRFQVVRERLSEVTLVLEDGSDMARSFPSGGEGRYEVHTRMRVATRALPAN
jgi:hypothetical protein